MFKRYLLGPVVMIVVLLFIHFGSGFGLTPTLALAVIPMTLSTYFGGLRSSLTCSLLVGIYAFWSPNYDYSRSVQVALAFAVAGYLGGILKHRDRLKTTLIDHTIANGNVEKITEALGMVRQLKAEVRQNEWAMRLAVNIESNLANALAITTGFHHLWIEIQEVEQWAANPANMLKWQSWGNKKGD